MSTSNPLFAIIIFLIAYATIYAVSLKYKVDNLSSRYETIDGLRGFLAIAVFIHHASFWFEYIKMNRWEAPKSNLYTQLGSTSVAFFFMITSFLFISKLLNLKEKEFNWNSFFISRFFRLIPMYIFSLSIIVLVVMIITDWKLNVGIFKFLEQIFMWVIFTITSNPNINNFSSTNLINAGVIWSLPYEWLFYFGLPLISLFILKKKQPLFYLLISLVFCGIYFYSNLLNIDKIHFSYFVHHILSFVGGALAALVIKFKPFGINLKGNFFNVLILISLILILFYKDSNNIICKVLIIIIFILVASGNTLFGVLKNSSLKLLGDISYSTYLIHGIILFAVFYFGFGFEKAKSLTSLEFCIIVFLITPLVVILSFTGYRLIEKPYMEISKKYTNRRLR